MSLFLGNSAQYAYVQVDPEKIKLAEMQFNATSETFNRLLGQCRQKCIQPEYGEGELNTGETTCVDRCVAKYVKTNVLIGTHLTEQGINPYNDMPEYKKVRSIVGYK